MSELNYRLDLRINEKDYLELKATREKISNEQKMNISMSQLLRRFIREGLEKHGKK